MTDCTEYEVLLSARLDGELTRSESARLDAHLAACPSCQALAAQLEALRAELEGMNPVPPASLAENVMEQVGNEAKTIPFPAKPAPKKHLARYGAFAAALALVIAGGSFLAADRFGASSDMAETAAVAAEAEDTLPDEDWVEAVEAPTETADVPMEDAAAEDSGVSPGAPMAIPLPRRSPPQQGSPPPPPLPRKRRSPPALPPLSSQSRLPQRRLPPTEPLRRRTLRRRTPPKTPLLPFPQSARTGPAPFSPPLWRTGAEAGPSPPTGKTPPGPPGSLPPRTPPPDAPSGSRSP